MAGAEVELLHVPEGPQMTPMMIVIIILGPSRTALLLWLATPLGKRMCGAVFLHPSKMIVLAAKPA